MNETQYKAPPSEPSPRPRGGGKETGTTPTAAKDASGETASNDTKAARDEAARILEDFLQHSWAAANAVSSVVVVGEASWVTEVAVWVSKRTVG